MDILKLDRSILELATTNLRRRQVLLAIIELSKKLGFSIVAEGVETERQLGSGPINGIHSSTEM